MYSLTLLSSYRIEHALTYYSPIFAISIYIIACERGVISHILQKDIFQKIASFSFEFYMIHELVLIIFRRMFINLNYHWLIKNIYISIPAFIISIMLAQVLSKYIKRINIAKVCELVS